MSKLFADLYTQTVEIQGEKFTIKKLSLKDQMEASKTLEGDMVKGSVEMLSKSLVKWETAEGVAVETSDENIMRLCADVVLKLSQEISKYNGLETEKEKN